MPGARVAAAHTQRNLTIETQPPFPPTPPLIIKQLTEKQEQDNQNGEQVMMDDLVEEDENSVEIDSPVA